MGFHNSKFHYVVTVLFAEKPFLIQCIMCTKGRYSCSACAVYSVKMKP